MNPSDMNQLDCDSHLPPRKRLFAGFNKLNSNGSSSPSPSSISNGSSSVSGDVQSHLDNLLASRFNNDQNQSPEELVEATRSIAKAAVKAAKAAREFANEKALISTKAIAAAKRALELVDYFPKEAMADCKERSPKKKHVPVELLYSKRQLRDEEEELACKLHRPIDNKYHGVLRTFLSFEENGSQRNKRQKKNKTGGSSSSIVTSSMSDIVGVVDSDSSYEGLESNRKLTKALKPDEEEESNSLCKRRGEVKLKKLPLSICNTRDQENGISSASPLPVAQPPENGVIPVKLVMEIPECEKQNKAQHCHI